MNAVPAYQLEEAGFSRVQVEALSSFIGGEAVRRSDLIEVKSELKEEIGKVREEIGELRSEARLTRSMIGFTLAVQVGIFAKFLIQ